MPSAAAALSPPQALLAEAKFEVGSQVRTVVDTTPGVDLNQYVVVRSVVVELKAGAVLWTYIVRSNHYGRNKILLYFNHLASATGWTAQAHKGRGNIRVQADGQEGRCSVVKDSMGSYR